MSNAATIKPSARIRILPNFARAAIGVIIERVVVASKPSAFRGERLKKLNSLLVAGFAALCAGEAAAHHSFAMFDPEKLLTQTGTVKELEWSNPHVWLHVMVPDQAAG